jgi:hypothetical protein
MWSNGPWAQDPYHVVVSFAVLSVPLVAGLCMSRVPLCRRDAPLPTRRARDLLRISRILLVLVLATVAGAWISVAWPAQRYSWTAPTVAAFAELAVLTVALLWAGHLLWRAFKTPIRAAAGPDWLADVITLGERVCGRLGALRTPALAILRWTDRRVISGLRRYPLPAAAILAAVPGMAVAILQGVQEGYSPGGYRHEAEHRQGDQEPIRAVSGGEPERDAAARPATRAGRAPARTAAAAPRREAPSPTRRRLRGSPRNLTPRRSAAAAAPSCRSPALPAQPGRHCGPSARSRRAVPGSPAQRSGRTTGLEDA